MSDRSDSLASWRAFITDPTDAHAETLRRHLASDVVVTIHTTNEKGADAALSTLKRSLFHTVVSGGHWEKPGSEGDIVTQMLSLPAKAIAAGFKFSFTFDGNDKLARIEGGWLLPPPALVPEPITLTAAMRARLDDAEKDRMPVLFAYVTPDGRPEQMCRNGIHTRGDDQLAFWNPRPEGSFLASVAANPRVSAIYRHDHTHEMLELWGRARLITDEEEARQIYDARPDLVRRRDPDRNGVAVVIDLDRVTGLIHATETGALERILMARHKTE